MRWKIFLLILSLLVGSSAMGTELEELEEIRKAIREKGAKWEAGETSVSKLSPEERRRLLGDNLADEFPEIPGVEIEVPKYLPSEYDWRNADGHFWMTPIGDQENCGACVAFGAVGALEANLKIRANNFWIMPDLSEQHLFSCSGGDCDYGMSVSTAMNYLKNNGTPDEDCFPYTASDHNCGQTCGDWQARARKISNWAWTSREIPDIKQAIFDYGPVVGHFDVYTDFFSYNSGVYEYVWGDYEGGHAITMLGWSDSHLCWICKNSWSSNWGEYGPYPDSTRGWFRIKYGECQIEYKKAAWLIPTSKGPDGIVLDRDSFHFALPPDSSDSDSLYISNVGDSTFIFDITFNQPWLFVSPQSDTLDSNEVSLLDVSVSSSGLPGGVYPGTLSVYASDPGPGEVPLYHIDVPVTLDVNPPFVRGDIDANGGYTLGDGLFFLNYFFSGFPVPVCGDACDVDDSGNLTLADGLYFLNYFFASSPAIPPPCGIAPGACGSDPTPDELGCGSFPPCGAKAKVVVSAPLVSVKEASEKVIVRDAEVEDGEVVVAVELVNVEDITGVDITLGYDASMLKAEKVEGGEGYDYFVGYTEDAGKVRIGIVPDLEMKDAMGVGERVIAEVVFKVKGSLSSDVKITVEKVDLYGRGVKQVKSEWIGGLVKVGAGLPKEFALSQNYPNPFNPTTLIKYALPVDCQVRLDVYNVVGQRVTTLVDGQQKAGYNVATWDSKGNDGELVSSGVYFYRLQAGDFKSVRKLVILR